VSTLLFVYGTLKRGCSNHRYLADQTLVGIARTPPGYRLYDLGGYPGMVSRPDDTLGVTGEVWSVDDDALERLDRFEGLHEGLYRREPVSLRPPFDGEIVHAYFSELSVEGRREVGHSWDE
jgi:gamma-glutamylcyclotransferase (GGCT)/AIG2-like uncharacterized protein YtfP